MKNLLFLLMMAIVEAIGYTLSGCNQMKEKSRFPQRCNSEKHEVHIYVNNLSFTDTIAETRLDIDDSLFIKELISTNRSSSGKFYKIVQLCEGPHRINARFGRYTKDTTLIIKTNVSLDISMNYNPKWEPQDNGMMVNLLVRDGIDRGGD